MNIGILVIATNKYIKFISPLVESINKYFLKNHKITVYCFTNIMDYKTADNVVKIEQEHMPWPMPTLKRYEIFSKNKTYYENMDVLYYLDADMLINDFVGDEFLPDDKDLLCVIHPGYFRDKIQSFERRYTSTAFVDNKHYTYHCGGVQGGKTIPYLTACEKIAKNINIDMKNNIIAVWHDESHWNKYLISSKVSYKELDSSYCYPESWNIPFTKRILALDKDHTEMRS
jgi:histo-blood group ABO system transferase